ncbi:hypothetical protein SAMN05445504_9583 [Burkholderia sp. CF099]|nr:hypothetical protein SAMN06266956_0282 [Paraburkholderia hospita]SKD05749.1 hypothetical protein SAMN05445504_9583 [Burkholderia sp. CF099]
MIALRWCHFGILAIMSADQASLRSNSLWL